MSRKTGPLSGHFATLEVAVIVSQGGWLWISLRAAVCPTNGTSLSRNVGRRPRHHFASSLILKFGVWQQLTQPKCLPGPAVQGSPKRAPTPHSASWGSCLFGFAEVE